MSTNLKQKVKISRCDMTMIFRTRSGFRESPRRLGEPHVGAEWPQDIVLPRLVYFETFPVRIEIDNLREVAVANVEGGLSLRWRSSAMNLCAEQERTRDEPQKDGQYL